MARVIPTIFALTLVALAAAPAVAQSGKKSSNSAAPATPVAECADLAFQDGQMTCSCPAGSGGAGSVWGSGPYTADSAICKAAVHAGVIDETGGVVTLISAPGQDSYASTVANGVTTSGWGSYGESFDFSGVSREAPAVASALGVCTTMPDGIDELECTCPPNGDNLSIWGNDPYTADSDICTAARHVGYIEADSGGDVYVLRLQGLASYYGDENNGITSGDWDSYESSIIFDWNR